MAAAGVAAARLPTATAAMEQPESKPRELIRYHARYFRYLPSSTRRLYVLEPWLMPIGAMQIAASLIQRWWRLAILPGIWERLDAAEAAEFELAAAQGRWPEPVRVPERVLQGPDEFLSRRRWNELPLYHVATLQIQRFCRARSPGMAAVRVQKWVRKLRQSQEQKHCYHQYRDMCKRFEQGTSPLELLKVINPREAELVDPASAISVMLRLGGYKFPPRIYYKMFLNGPVCDVGAFAPRTYAVKQQDDFGGGLHLEEPSSFSSQSHAPTASAQMSVPGESVSRASLRAPSLPPSASQLAPGTRTTLQVGSSTFQAVIGPSTGPSGATSEAGWYQRHEGNGWRPVAARTLQEAEMDPVSRATAARSVSWHWSKLKRREDKAAKHRQRRRKWMMRLYREGLAATAASASASASARGATDAKAGDEARYHEREGKDANMHGSEASWDTADLHELSDEELRVAAEKRVRERLGMDTGKSVSLEGFLEAVMKEDDDDYDQQSAESGLGMLDGAPMPTEAEELLATGCPVDFDAPDWDDQADDLLRWAADLDSDLYQAEWAGTAVSSTA